MELKEALVLVLIFLFPLSIYCLVLAFLNRRPGPVLVAGMWDFLGLLFGLSGFLLAGGPAILSNMNATWRGLFQSDAPAGEGQRLLMTALLVLYFLFLAAGVLLLLWRRRGTMAVYNIETGRFDEVFGQVLDSLGLSWARAGNRFYIRVDEGPPPAQEAYPGGGEQRLSAMPLPAAPVTDKAIVVETEPFPALRHVTVRWGTMDAKLRQEVEGELARALSGMQTHYNPATGWLLSAASALFILIFVVMLFLLAVNILVRG